MKYNRVPVLLLVGLVLLLVVALPVISQSGTTMTDDEITTFRWRAMARFYADSDLLTDDPSVAVIARWSAMAEFYESHDLLIWQEADFVEASACSAYRWRAMAGFYESNGLLN